MVPKRGSVSYTGQLRFTVPLRYTGKELDQARRLTAVGEIIPERVYLVWVREIGGEWSRATAYLHGSRVEGHERLDMYAEQMNAVGRWGYRELFTRERGELRPWAALLPGLRNTIEEIEMYLPESDDKVALPPVRG